MAGAETLLRSLLELRHLTQHEAFNAQFRRAAKFLADVRQTLGSRKSRSRSGS